MNAWIQRIDRIFDAGVLTFGAWTVCAHVAVSLGWGLDALCGLGVVAVAAVAVLDWRWGRGQALHIAAPRDSTPAPTPSSTSSSNSTSSSDEIRAWPRIGVAAGAAAAGGAVALGQPLIWVWLIAAATVGFACVYELTLDGRYSTNDPPLPAGRAESALLVILTVVCVATVLFAHRPDADDSFYLNLAVAAADDPSAPLLATDTLHRVPEVPLALPVYRVHSLELLHAALSRWTDRPVMDFAHGLIPVLAALFIPFVYARRTRGLTPRSWPAATAIAVAVLLCAAAANQGWASFGLLRVHQGKGLLLTLALPALLGYAVEFARRGGARGWVLLASAQVGAVGISASALWLAPLVSGTALLASIPDLRRRSSWLRLGAGLTASTYVLVAGLVLRGQTVAAFEQASVPGPEMALSSLELATQSLRAVMAPGIAGAVALFIAIGAWSFARTRIARRISAFTAAATLVLWTPFAAEHVAANLTSAATYWRVLWLLPVPALVAVVLGAPLERTRTARAALTVAVSTAVAFGALIAVNPKSFALTTANQVRLGAPGWKVPETEFDAARAIVSAAGPQDRVLAPRRVAPWIPTFHHHPTSLVVRVEYLPVLTEALGKDELERRMMLVRLVSGRAATPNKLAMLRRAIVDDDLRVVCLSLRAMPPVTAVLQETGFQMFHQNADYQVWKR